MLSLLRETISMIARDLINVDMKIAISGASGFIGRNLKAAFSERDWNVVTISRNDFLEEDRLLANIEGADVVVHLAGAPILQRWTEDHKKEIYTSRVETTRKMARAIEKSRHKPGLFISTSAIGILRSDKRYDEDDAEYNEGFIGTLCREWEREAFAIGSPTRVVVCRLAVVLDPREGALRKMLWAFRLGLGGRIGSGRQWFSWIHRDDLIRAYMHVIETKSLRGAVHLASPETMTNKEYTKVLGKVLKRPAIIPIPVLLLRVLYGAAATTLSEGQGAVPQKLIRSGFVFQYPGLEDALRDLLS
jgi:uncharacterized protein (TIGR01777 family)